MGIDLILDCKCAKKANKWIRIVFLDGGLFCDL